MYKRYNLSDIQNKVIDLLQNNNPMSSTEISKNLGTNRITISKYLDILYFQKIINKKRIGSVNFWFLEPGIININPKEESYSEIQQKLILSLINGEIEKGENIIISLMNKGVDLRKIITDIYFPVWNTIFEFYVRGKIGKTERIHMLTNLFDYITLLKRHIITRKSKHNLKDILVIVSGDDESMPICNMLNIYIKNIGINSTLIGNVESYLDPFFDIDFQRYINKISNKIKGKIYVCIISNNERSIKFLFLTLSENKFREKTEIIIFTKRNTAEKVEKTIQEYIIEDFEKLLNKIESEIK